MLEHMTTIDLVVLSRDAGSLDLDVERGIRSQRAVRVVVHRVQGVAAAADRSRCETIERARNEGKTLGHTPWLMFLDDDVVLEPECVATLLEELVRRPAYGALAADYLGERRTDRVTRHVAMGATLFRRAALGSVEGAARGED